MTADQPFATLLATLAARQPTPGGGAASAAAAALGCATGAMAARYTTGARWADRTAEAEDLARRLDAWRDDCLRLADADGAAFAAAQAARKAGDGTAQAEADLRSRRVPADLIRLARQAAEALAAFAPRCNPLLRSDVQVGLHLLAGATRGAWATFLVNQPPADELTATRADLDRVTDLEPPAAPAPGGGG